MKLEIAWESHPQVVLELERAGLRMITRNISLWDKREKAAVEWIVRQLAIDARRRRRRGKYRRSR